MKINPIATWKAWRREGLLAQTSKKYKRNQDKRKRCNGQCNLFLNETQWRSEVHAVSYLNSAFKDGTEVPGPFPLAACSALHRPLSFSPVPSTATAGLEGPEPLAPAQGWDGTEGCRVTAAALPRLEGEGEASVTHLRWQRTALVEPAQQPQHPFLATAGEETKSTRDLMYSLLEHSIFHKEDCNEPINK